MNHPILLLLARWTIMGFGVMLATRLVPGITYDDTTTLLVVVLLLSFLNAVLKPLLVLFTLPFIVFTMGLGIILINAVLFLLVGKLVDGFYVASFGSALFGAIIVSITSLLLNGLTKPPPPGDDDRGGPGGGRRRSRDADVIDV